MDEEQKMPETPPEADGLTEEPVKTRQLPKLLAPLGIIVALLVFQGFTSRILVKQVFFPSPVQKKPEAKEKEPVGEFYMIQDLIINPAATGGRRHLLVSLGLEYHDPKLGEELTKRDPQIRDNLITLLAGQEVSVLTDIHYRENIRTSLLKAVNYHLQQGEVDRLYFVKYVFQ